MCVCVCVRVPDAHCSFICSDPCRLHLQSIEASTQKKNASMIHINTCIYTYVSLGPNTEFFSEICRIDMYVDLQILQSQHFQLLTHSIFRYEHTHSQVHTGAHTHIPTHVCVCVCVYVCARTRVYACA